MKIKNGYKLKTISGRQTVIPDRRIIKNFNSLIILNDIAVFLWENLIENDFTDKELTESLIKKFKMSYRTAKSNTDVFIKTMQKTR